MELYAKYLKETENVDCVYTNEFFITYLVENDNVYIFDAYSIPEIRGQGKVTGTLKKMIEEFKQKGYNYMFSSTSERKSGFEKSDEIHLKLGFKFTGRDENEPYIKNYCYDILGE